MSLAVIYGLKTCDTCRKAIKAFSDAGRMSTFEDISTTMDLEARLPLWINAVGAFQLVNRRSTTWRGLNDEEKAKADTDPAALLAAHPKLIKRPVIEADGEVLVGWTPDVRAALGL